MITFEFLGHLPLFHFITRAYNNLLWIVFSNVVGIKVWPKEPVPPVIRIDAPFNVFLLDAQLRASKPRPTSHEYFLSHTLDCAKFDSIGLDPLLQLCNRHPLSVVVRCVSEIFWDLFTVLDSYRVCRPIMNHW